MAVNKKVENSAEKHLIVGSLEVLGAINGSGIKEIRHTINSVQQSVQSYFEKKDDYWSEISQDGTISAVEKKTLYREWENLKQTFLALDTTAQEKLSPEDYATSDRIKAWKLAKTQLQNYFDNNHIFDDMSENSPIADRDVFNALFTEYYEEELYVQIMISQGMAGKDGVIKVLDSLTEIGTEGEVAIYGNHIYRYENSAWQQVDTQEDYWTDLTDDSHVTPLEKLTLKNKWISIQKEKTAIEYLADLQNLTENETIENYYANYEALDVYLNTTLALFVDLSTTTDLTEHEGYSKREWFNKVFENYYAAYATAQEIVNGYTWQTAADDLVITPQEKINIRKEWRIIQKTYISITDKARDLNIINTNANILAYITAYGNLAVELESTLNLFDEEKLDEIKTLPDEEARTAFDQYFQLYYMNENLATQALAVGEVGTTNVRKLDNLQEEGQEGDLGAYCGELYQYFNGAWKKLGTNGYLGLYINLPQAEITGNYFLANDNPDYPAVEGFIYENTLILPNGYTLKSADGEDLIFNITVNKGYIYEYVDSYWHQVVDKKDYRYVVAMTELSEIGEGLPGVFQEPIDHLQEEIDNIEVHNPVYLGKFTYIPSAEEGDWFTYTGTTQSGYSNVVSDVSGIANGTLQRGYVCRLIDTKWHVLDPTKSSNLSYYMSAYKDILDLKELNPGFFSYIMCQALFSDAAAINTLQTQTITLASGGTISGNYVANQQGFLLNSNGDIYLNSAKIRGNTDIGGNTTINGICNVDKLHMNKIYSIHDTGFSNGDIWLVG